MVRYLEQPIRDADELNQYVYCVPPAEVPMLTTGVPVEQIPIVGPEVSIYQALRTSLYAPMDDGSFMGFRPWFIEIGLMAHLHAEREWQTAQAYLGQMGLKPIAIFSSTVRTLRGHQVYVGDFRALAT